MKRFWVLLLMLCAVCLPAAAAQVELPVRGGAVSVQTTQINDEDWLFLPSFSELSALYPDAVETEEEGVWLDEETGLRIMQSKNLRALFLFSADPVNEGREWLEADLEHENETTGSMAIVSADGTVDYADDLRQLRGRGNGTWEKEKRPYQFKLENRADLLKTGLSSERARTWVLLAEATDGTYLHNRITLDLGLEMGMENTSRSEFVDLYYDGEYRGLYLLAEKVEIDEARIDEMDYDKLLEAWNERTSPYVPEELPLASGTNRFGNEYRFAPDLLDNGVVNAGAYLLEMDSDWFGPNYEPTHFRLSDRSIISLKSPEVVSEPMARYISELLTAARQTLDNGGVHPENGRTIEDDFDVESFAKLALLNELSWNIDGFYYSSTFFILPAGETRFEAGPAWDYDLAYRYGGGIRMQDMKGTTSWLEAFYRCDTFVEKLQQLYREQMEPLITQVLLGEQSGRYLRPLDDYAQEIRSSRLMNEKLWKVDPDYRLEYGYTFEEELALLKRFLQERSAWLHRALVENAALGADGIEGFFDVRWAYPEEGAAFRLAPNTAVRLVSCTSTQLSEAIEEDYGVYEVEIVLAAKNGHAFETPRVLVNGCELNSEIQPDGTLLIRFAFEDLSYRPVDYYGDDVGLIYNPDFYAANYPEIAAEYEDDPEGLMDYFFDEGVYQDQRGNPYFKPSTILLHNLYLRDILGEDWQNYYWDFLYYGFDEGWLWNVGETYYPQPMELPDGMEDG